MFHISLVHDTLLRQGVVKCVYIYVDFNLTESDSSLLTLDMHLKWLS